MYIVKYEKYYNHYMRKQEVKSFYSIGEIEDWLFGIPKGKLNNFNLFFINPDSRSVIEDGKLYLDNSCISAYDNEYHYWIEQIEYNEKIIYSCGTFTNGICYWNKDIKKWIKHCRNRKKNSEYNFG